MIVALRRIEPGEEITYDYGREYIDYFFWTAVSVARCVAKRQPGVAKNRNQKHKEADINVQLETSLSKFQEDATV